MQWIDPKDKKPKSGDIIWAIIWGRPEQTSNYGFIADPSIVLITCDPVGDPRSLDYTTAYRWPNHKTSNPYVVIIAWMPYEEMDFPDFVKEYLNKE